MAPSVAFYAQLFLQSPGFFMETWTSSVATLCKGAWKEQQRDLLAYAGHDCLQIVVQQRVLPAYAGHDFLQIVVKQSVLPAWARHDCIQIVVQQSVCQLGLGMTVFRLLYITVYLPVWAWHDCLQIVAKQRVLPAWAGHDCLQIVAQHQKSSFILVTLLQA